jgi:hypothetical protein
MKTDPVTVRTKVHLPQIPLVTTKIGPFSPDSEVSLERWQAEILAEWGIVEWDSDPDALLLEAYASRDTEQDARALQATQDLFHLFPELVRSLEKQGVLTQKIGAVRALLDDLVSSRTNKITRIARMAQDPPDTLSPEELWLYDALRRVLDTWGRNTQSLAETQGTDAP